MPETEVQNKEMSAAADTAPFSTGTATGVLMVSVIFGYVVTMIFAFAGIMGSSMDTGKSAGNIIMKFGLLIGTVCFVVPAWWYAGKENKSIRSVFRFNAVSSHTLIFTVVLSLGLIVVTDTIDKWIAPMINSYLDSTIGVLSPELMSDRILEKMKEEFKIGGWLDGTLLILAAVFAAGICEEMLIRGMFQGALEKRMHAAYAVVVSSLVFSFIHINPWGGIQIFVIAVFLGLIAWRTGSIVPTIIMHALNNFIVIVFNNLEPETLSWYGDEHHIEPVMIGAGILFSMIGIIGLWKSVNNVPEKKIVS